MPPTDSATVGRGKIGEAKVGKAWGELNEL